MTTKPAAPFRQRIRQALANPTLQGALDANAERRLQARLAAFAALPEAREELRQQAHALRARTIQDLDRLIDQFAQNAEAKGVQVHRAANGTEAAQICLELAQQAGAKLAVKAKSMVSEEIRLNQALETGGVRTLETDLGEYIVQLRGERPAHILTPAVHLTRAQVGQTFAEKLGIPYTENIPDLVAAARQALRQAFLDAEVGISGANFGIAETGGLCIVSNEGNARLCTSLPPIHIALLGIERLTPALDDLALLLKLLPRSATGQKSTVYVSLLHGPRAAGEVDGPLERHVILVDNGRQALRRTPLAEALYCIRCGACLNICPVFRELGGHAYVGAAGAETPYPGPIGSVISPGLLGMAEFGQLARASSLCGACREACPVDIDLPGLLLRVRAGGQAGPVEYERKGSTAILPTADAPPPPAGLRLGLRIFAWASADPRRFTVLQRTAGWFSSLLPAKDGWLALPAFTGWGVSRKFPRPARTPFRTRFAALANAPEPAMNSRNAASPEEQPAKHPADTNRAVNRFQPRRIERFTAEAQAAGAHCCICQPAELTQRILDVLQSAQITAIQAWETAYLPAGLVAKLQAAGVTVQFQPDPGLRAGLTGALAGIADTGALVLAHGPGRPASASLLPEIHLAVVAGDTILEQLQDALRLPEVRQASNLALICGPSRTADIEMALTVGAHGPKAVYIFCLE